MPYIEKTYIEGCDYPLYRKWWIENYEKMQKEIDHVIYLRTFDIFRGKDWDDITPEFLLNNTKDLDYYSNVGEFAIWNTTVGEDKWLIKNCPIESFRETMLSVHSPKWDGFKGQKWIPKPNFKPKCRK